eukprot:evm.model.scf_197EXC.1 EVM.evm.TU.scf_197EXC.1   scf_197EXC:12774-13106(+)
MCKSVNGQLLANFGSLQSVTVVGTNKRVFLVYVLIRSKHQRDANHTSLFLFRNTRRTPGICVPVFTGQKYGGHFPFRLPPKYTHFAVALYFNAIFLLQYWSDFIELCCFV